MHVVAIGGSDAGISAALRIRELDSSVDVTVVVADAFPNFSICGIPYYVSGVVADWRSLAHRTIDDLTDTGMKVRLNTSATSIDVARRLLQVVDGHGQEETISYDQLIVGTGAMSTRPPIEGLVGDEALGPLDGVHLLHSMGDTFALMQTIESLAPTSAVIVGAGYIGLEMAEGLTARGIAVTQLEQLPEVLPTVDSNLGALVRAELVSQGVVVRTGTTVKRVRRSPNGSARRLEVDALDELGTVITEFTDMVLVVVGVRPNSALAESAGAELGIGGAIAVDRQMRTNLDAVFAAGDCVVTHHRLAGLTYLPLGTTAHKQGRIAGENALGGEIDFAGSLGTQVVKVFEMAVSRTGLRDHEACAVGFNPLTVQLMADDHKAYYPGSHPITMRFTGDQKTGRLLGVQLYGHRQAEVAKRIDIAAAAIFNEMTVGALSELDLSYTPPLGSPWDAIQLGAQAWVREQRSSARGLSEQEERRNLSK